MKKLLSLTLTIIILSAFPFEAMALMPDKSELELLADELVQISYSINPLSTTFTEIDVFVDEAHERYPDMTELELALFVMEYTLQDPAGLSEEMILRHLEYDNITTSVEYVYVNENGESVSSEYDALPYATYHSTDGYMKIETSYTYRYTSGANKYYSVWARATWLKFSPVHWTDAFCLSKYNAIRDSSFGYYASVSQTFECRTCGETTDNYRSVTNNSRVDDDLEIQISNGVPYIVFDHTEAYCDNCSSNAICLDEYFSAYLNYSIYNNTNMEIFASYAHQTIGVNTGELDVSISQSGDISFDWSTSLVNPGIVDYNADSVDIEY